MLLQIFQDALFSAIAAIGFAAISRPPRRAYLWCALLAALGHSARFVMTSGLPDGLHIIPATLAASFCIGCGAVFAAHKARFPAETCLFPALLPMIPGIYAYKAFGAMALCLTSGEPEMFTRNFALFGYNAFTCCAILMSMVTGAIVPVFLFNKISFSATR